MYDLLEFRRCSDLYGNTVSVDWGKRNGQPHVFVPPTSIREATPEPEEVTEQEKLFVNLTPTERNTWRKLLSGQSIAAIAREEGVSRPAIYSRIAGNRKGQGGMVAKNFWVLLWWRLRQRLTAPTSINFPRS